MKQRIVGIIYSLSNTEKQEKLQEIKRQVEFADNELYGIIDITVNQTICDLRVLLNWLKKENVVGVIADSNTITYLKKNQIIQQIAQANLEITEIYGGIYKDKNTLFVICDQMSKSDFDTLICKLLHDSIQDVYILLANNDHFDEFVKKVQVAAKFLNIRVLLFQMITR